MFNSNQFNTTQFNQKQTIIISPIAVVTFNGIDATFQFVIATINVTLATMSVDGINAASLGDRILTAPLAIMSIEQRGNDVIQILAHQIYKGKYLALPRIVNRVCVLGMDINGNMVFGDAKDAVINEEILRLISESMISSSTEATTVATNILSKERLKADRGNILVIPNCGMESWDAISLTDSVCNQSSASYRVGGWQFTYDSAKAKYEHVISLTSV